MLTLDLFRIPVRVHAFFWLLAFYVSGGFHLARAEDWLPLLARMGVVFLSIVIHELGHAWVTRLWGGYPVIELHGMGGVTYLGGGPFSRWKHLAITVGGPTASLVTSLVCYVLLEFTELPFKMALSFGAWANLIWTVLNLLPILPMDGGQILRDLIGPRHERAARIIGMLTACAVAFFCYWIMGDYLLTIFMVIFAWLNFKGSIRAGGVQ